MADRLKGITVQIGGDTTGLRKALSDTNRQIKTTQSELKDVERLLKLDPKNTELLAQKQKLLTKAVDETKEKLNALKEAEKQAQEQFQRGEISEQQYDALKREIAATENQLKGFQSQLSAMTPAVKTFADKLENVSEKAGKVAEKTATMSKAAGVALAALGAGAIKAAAASDELNTLAKQTGFSTEELQKFQYASELVDVSVDSMMGAIKKMRRNMVTDSEQTAEAWERLGVSITDNNGELRDSVTVFYEVVEALGAVENGTERDTLAMLLFGKSADDLAGIVDDGGKALKELGKEAEELGVIIDQKTLDEMNALNDEFDKVKTRAKMEALKIGGKALKALEPVFKKATEAIQKFFDWLGKMDEGTIIAVASTLALAAAVSPLAKLISGASTAVNALSKAFSFLAANPIVLAVAAVTALVVALGTYISKNGEAAKSIDVLTEAEKKEVAAAKEAADAFNERNAAIQADIDGINSQFDYTSKLAQELLTLADSSGKVEEKDRARAGVIINELNKALGTEYELTGNQIKNYKELASEIGKVIEQKRANALLTAYEEEYTAALKNRAKQEKAVKALEKEVANAEVQYEKNKNNAWGNSKKIYGDYLTAKKTELAQAKQQERDYSTAIITYEAAAAQAYEGNYAVVERVFNGEVRAIKSATGEISIQFEKTAATAETAGKNISDNFARGIKSGNDKAKSAGRDVATKAKEGAESVSAKSTGLNLLDGLLRGLTDSKKLASIKAAARSAAKSALSAMNKAADIHSPSKETEKTGRFLGEGLAIGLQKSTSNAVAAAKKQASSVLSAYNGNAGILGAAAASKTTNVGGVNISVYGQQGMNPQAIAKMVMNEFNRTLKTVGATTR